MKILAVDTSGFEGSIALSDDRHVVAEYALPGGRRHAQTLVLEVDRLLRTHTLRPREIDAVAVSIGPGSFTGLRVGVVFAKTFAWANDAGLVAVDTLQAIAQQIDDRIESVTVISDAQRQEVFVNEYTWDNATQCRTPAGDVCIQSVASVVARDLPGHSQLLTGPGLIKFQSAFSGDSPLAEASCWQPRAKTVAEIGSVMLDNGKRSDVYNLEPLYIRRSYAEEKADTA